MSSEILLVFMFSAVPIPDRSSHQAKWYAFSAEMIGAYDVSMKWMRGYGTRLVWNSVMSTLSAPSKRSDAVSEEITWPRRRFKFVYVGRSMSRLRPSPATVPTQKTFFSCQALPSWRPSPERVH